MSFENPETWWLVLRSGVLLTAFACFAWALLASRRDTTLNFAQAAVQQAGSQAQIHRLSEQLNELHELVRDLALPSPMVTPRPVTAPPPPVPSVTPSGARGYETAIRMARGGASIDEIVSTCGTTRPEARLLRRLHFAAGATAA